MALAAALLATLVVPACSRDAPKPDRVINTEADDAALNEAMRRARETAPNFWAKFEGNTPGATEYAVKLGMTGQDGFKEFIWANPIRREGDQIVARLANQPDHLQPLALGSEVRVDQSLLADWTYERNGRLYGHFTTRVLMPRMTPEERAQVEGSLSPEPLEAP